MNIHWSEQAELLLRQLCPQAQQVFETSHKELSRQTRLAYLLLAEYLWSDKTPRLAGSLLAGSLLVDSLLVGIGGGQGAGKSTLVDFVSQLINAEKGLVVQILSLDDFYLSKARRQQLAKSHHPLFATRGVPGTHDIALLNEVLDHIEQGETPPIPIFEKTSDDLLSKNLWHRAAKNPDIILLEGWCMGVYPQQPEALVEPVNQLERERDRGGSWRREVNRRLATDYARLFKRLDRVVYLQVPDMSAVRQWRNQQEHSRGLSRQQVEQFVQYFERLTCWMQQDLPQRADLMLALGEDHEVLTLTYQEVNTGNAT